MIIIYHFQLFPSCVLNKTQYIYCFLFLALKDNTLQNITVFHEKRRLDPTRLKSTHPVIQHNLFLYHLLRWKMSFVPLSAHNSQRYNTHNTKLYTIHKLAMNLIRITSRGSFKSVWEMSYASVDTLRINFSSPQPELMGLQNPFRGLEVPAMSLHGTLTQQSTCCPKEAGY